MSPTAFEQDGGPPQKAALRQLHMLVVLICVLVTFLDGFDLQLISFVAPAIARELQIEKDVFGLIFSAGVVGMLVGMIAQGPISDRVGRKPLVLASLGIFGVATLACAMAHNATAFLVLRFFGGVGMGAVVPNVFALSVEIAPARARSRIVVLLGVGVPIGGLIAGLLSSWLLPVLGWRMLFVIGGVLPLLLSPVIMFWLPESPMFLTDRAQRKAGAARQQDLDAVDLLIRRGWSRPEAVSTPFDRQGIGALFSADLRRNTLLIWLITAGNMVIYYSLLSWLPLILTAKGTAESSAALSGTMLNFGAVVGSFPLAWAADRFHTSKVLASVLFVGVGIFFASGLLLDGDFKVFLTMCALCGVVAGGGNLVLNAVVGQIYPTALRATGIGLAGVAGRVGAIVGPSICGFLLAGGLSGSGLLALFALPALSSGFGCMMLRLRAR